MRYESKIDYETTVVCPDCGVEFHPSGDNEEFCLRCLAVWEMNRREMEGEYDYEI